MREKERKRRQREGKGERETTELFGEFLTDGLTALRRESNHV